MPTFFSPNALESMRSSGYTNTQYALAELVDNAFDAEASEVKIIFFQKKERNLKVIDEILVCDDGNGMDDSLLQTCLQFGFTGNGDLDAIVRNKKKGKFGFGLPNASLSQAPEVHVFSCTTAKRFKTTCLSLKDLKDNDTIEIPDVHETALPPHYIAAGAVLNDEHGTIVSWRKCDLLSNTRAETIIQKGEALIGRIYRYLLQDGKKIELEVWEHNSNQNNFARTKAVSIVPNDPLFLMKDTYVARLLFKAAQRNPSLEESLDPATYYGRYSTDEGRCEPTNQKLDDKSHEINFEWRGKTHKLSILTSYVLPDIQHPGIRDGGSQAVGQFYFVSPIDPHKRQISFVRADREICSGNFGFYTETERQNRWWSIEIRFDPDSDDLLGVSNNKQGITFWQTPHGDISEEWDPNLASLQQAREHLWVELTRLIDDARRTAFKLVREEGVRWATEHPSGQNNDEDEIIPGATDETKKALENTDGKRGPFRDDQKERLLERLHQIFPAVDKDDVVRAVEKFDRSLVKGCLLYCPSENASLWSQSKIQGFLVIQVNTNHEFYARIMQPLRDHSFRAPLSAIELFISSLAWEEAQDLKEEKREYLEAFRSMVSIHLGQYLRENNIEITESDISAIDRSAEVDQG